MRSLILILAMFLPGCAVIDQLQKPEMLTVCALADVGTTVYAVSAGIAHEANPLLAPSVNAHHFFPLLASKLLYVGIIWWIYHQYQESQLIKGGVGVASAVTCGVAANNAVMILKSIH